MNNTQRATMAALGMLLLASALIVATVPRGVPFVGSMLSGGPIGLIIVMIVVFMVLGLLTLLTVWLVDRIQRR